ncbi:MAG TPA: hypothetical protein VML57_12775 [Burkholderiales bacterium]|nr:hypothetical protein [Burkholderiales bacterium]
MSAAATAAGYLYASGRLRGRGHDKPEEKEKARAAPRREIRVAALPSEEARSSAPKRKPKIEYRTRRWKPE